MTIQSNKDHFKSLISEAKQKYDGLDKRIKDEIDSMLDLYLYNRVSRIDKCESPIEQLLHIHLSELCTELINELLYLSENSNLIYKLQEEVVVKHKTYRVDFLITCQVDEKNYHFAIECDGHDFHEKTKEQAARDKSRDRELASIGYRVIRFTGSEIWNAPTKCVIEISDIIQEATGISEYWNKRIEEDNRAFN
ncbi:Protein of unknown function [Terribacillus saccharophilus]|uniref:Restriction endonuclease type II-like domain-containing protein n=1 Tax=Terribacillus saccharophilus TaxID=361277 RepID=A0AAX2EJU8_9BACI|nr:Protein of unknown function [Terribacillus saccharophilus]